MSCYATPILELSQAVARDGTMSGHVWALLQMCLPNVPMLVPCLVPIPTPAAQVCEATRPLTSEPVDLLCMHMRAAPSHAWSTPGLFKRT